MTLSTPRKRKRKTSNTSTLSYKKRLKQHWKADTPQISRYFKVLGQRLCTEVALYGTVTNVDIRKAARISLRGAA